MASPSFRAPHPSRRAIFAIGDVHGRYDLLGSIHQRLEKRLSERRYDAPPLIVHLGDLIDRGPSSVRCLRAALEWTHRGCESVVLPGNHEQMLIGFWEACSRRSPLEVQKEALSLWLQNGGYAVCDELGVDDCEDLKEVELALRGASVPEMLEKLCNSPSAIRTGHYLLVHAGIPCKPKTAGQEFLHPDDVPAMNWCSEELSHAEFDETTSPLWVREPFLNRTGNWPGEVVVVHGHTPSPDGPQIMHNRIGIDTGAFMTGRLTMLELHEDRMWFHEAAQV